MSNVEAPDEDGRRGVQSLEVGLRVIEALARSAGPLALKELASAADLSASSCHRYCASLLRAGWVRQEPGSSRYALGARLVEAGLQTLGRIDVVGAATTALERLVDATGHTGQLAVWTERGPTIVRWMPGRMAVRTSLTTGATLPLLTSATGRVFLAFLPARQTSVLAAREAMAGGGDPAALAARTRATGLGRVAGEHIPGLSALAAPVLDAYGEAAAVMTLVAAREGLAPGAAKALKTEAIASSRALGWGPDAGRLAPPEPARRPA